MGALALVPIGAHGQPLWTHLKEAREKGAEFRPFSYVTRVLTNEKGDRVTGVEYYDAQKQKQTQEASVVIMAAWSGQNPRILLNSSTDKHPNGLANKNQLVGKFMMTHSVAGTWALFDEDITPHMGTIGAQYMSYYRYAKTSYPNAFGSAFIVAGAAMKTNDFAASRSDLFGKDLAAFMKRAAKGITVCTDRLLWPSRTVGPYMLRGRHNPAGASPHGGENSPASAPARIHPVTVRECLSPSPSGVTPWGPPE